MTDRSALSVVWFFGMGSMGLFFPYYSLYLNENLALSGGQVGVILAVVPAIALLAQPIWGHTADRTGSRTRVLTLLALGASVGYLALGNARGFASAALFTAFLAFFQAPLMPTSIAVTLAATRNLGTNAFGRRRVWGTVGFFILVVSFPFVLERVEASRGIHPDPSGPSEPALGIMFPIAAVVVAAAGLAAFAIPRRGALLLRAARGDWRTLFSHPPYLRLLFFAVIAYSLMQAPLTFFPVFVRAFGGELETVSRMWILMLLLEFPLVAYSGASLDRLGARGLMATGTVAFGVRWTLCGLFPESAWVFPIQILHGVTVACLIVGFSLYVDLVVPENLRATGQNVLAMIGASLGGMISNLQAGWLMERVGPTAPYVVAGVGGLILAALLPLLLPPPRRP